MNYRMALSNNVLHSMIENEYICCDTDFVNNGYF